MPRMSTPAAVEDIVEAAPSGTRIPVRVSYEIIRLFSEGLYQSPQKAVEELVSNGYDAQADNVHVILPSVVDDATPESSEAEDAVSNPEGDASADDTSADEDLSGKTLWVIDNGTGLSVEGFTDLWRVAHSKKAEESDVGKTKKRMPIGQFGIGKLAAYV